MILEVFACYNDSVNATNQATNFLILAPLETVEDKWKCIGLGFLKRSPDVQGQEVLFEGCDCEDICLV